MVHTISLSDEELEHLEHILEHHCQAMLVEMRRTDTRQFKDKIRREHNICQRILSQVEVARHSTSTP